MASFFADPLGSGGTGGSFDLPTTPAVADSTALVGGVTLGIKVVPLVAGKFTGVKFYRSPDHDWSVAGAGPGWGTIWDQSGALRASALYPLAAPSDTGWLTAMFPTPLDVDRYYWYIAATITGLYSASYNFFYFRTLYDFAHQTTTGMNRPAAVMYSPPNHAMAPGNGRFDYGDTFPGSTYNATNYFIDVIFEPD